MKKLNQTLEKDTTYSKRRFTSGLPIHNVLSAGIDVGDTKYDVAIAGKNGYEVREYPTFTADLIKLVEWLKSEGITTAAIESTGVYWLNLYLMLEEAGIEPYLVNAKHVKNVTGRKRDDTDAIWLQKLHSCGLLQKSFQPEGNIRTLRTYVRQRKKLIKIGADSVRRMQKALELMNIKLHIVISDILGKTGMLMVEAILNGERDPKELLKLKDHRIKASEDEIIKSLEGIWKDEYLFMLKQAYEGYYFYQNQIKQCEEKIEKILMNQAAQVLEGDITDLEIKRKKKPRKNEVAFDAQTLLKVILGIDLCQIDSIGETTALELIAEIGTNMECWKSEKQFSAWLNLTPNTKITGGKIISSRMEKKKNQAGLTLRMAASNLSKSQSYLGEYARKMKSRVGKKGAVVASAHKLSRIIYTMIKNKKEFDDKLFLSNQQKVKEQRIRNLEKQLLKLKGAA
jgi:transposase